MKYSVKIIDFYEKNSHLGNDRLRDDERRRRNDHRRYDDIESNLSPVPHRGDNGGFYHRELSITNPEHQQ